MRLRNSAVDSSGSLPSRSQRRTWTKKATSTNAPAATSPTVSHPLSSAARTPNTTSTSPTADSTAPTVSGRRVGSADNGSSKRRLNSTIASTITAWNTNAARQLIAEVIRPPSNGPAAAPMPPIPLTTPKARAREVVSVNSNVVRMYTGGMSIAVPTPSRIELPMISTPRFGDTALINAPIP